MLITIALQAAPFIDEGKIIIIVDIYFCLATHAGVPGTSTAYKAHHSLHSKVPGVLYT